MTKLTNAEKDKLDNTCGNLRVTKLGTHVKSLEDFVNEGALATRANDVTSAINELYGMIANNECADIQIPPPGFFTLFGNDEDGKLYVYYNDEEHPPIFHHVETPGELEGTLYLYIADPEGENHFEMEIGHYIAVKHLDNYYTKAEIDAGYAIKNHASTANTYGLGSTSKYGHVKTINGLTQASHADGLALSAYQGKVLKTAVDEKVVTVEKQSSAEQGYAATYVVKQNGSQVGVKINIPKDFLVKSTSVKTCTTANQPVNGYEVGDIYIDWVVNSKDNTATDEHLYLRAKDIGSYPPDEVTLTIENNQFKIKNGGVGSTQLAKDSVITDKIKDSNVTTAKIKDGNVTTVKIKDDNVTTPKIKDSNITTDKIADGAVTNDKVTSITKNKISDFSHAHGNLQNDGKVGTSNNENKNVVTDGNGKITTEAKPTVPTANSTASNIKMDGTQSAGSLSTFAKADHVHPTDTSRASTDVATQSANGLMSSSDKTKLDGIATGANKTTIDSALSTTSTNPVQNKVIKAKIDTLATKEEVDDIIAGDIDLTGYVKDTDSRLADDRIPKVIEIDGTVNEPYDLDLVYGTGFYIGNRGGNKTSLHTPDDTYGSRYVLLVQAFGLNTYIKQVFTFLNNGKTYTRFKTTGNWSSWTEISYNGHTHHDTDIDWEGVALANQVSPLDMAMFEELSANRLAFLSGDNIIFEYSTDGGSTWTEGYNDADGKTKKLKLVTTSERFSGGNGATKSVNNQARITLKAGEANVASKIYMYTRKLMIYFSTAGSRGCKCKVETSTYGTPSAWTTIGTYNIDGYSGWNSIPLALTLGGFASQTNGKRIQNIRLTFSCTTIGNYNFEIQKIRLFGETCWTSPSTMATNGHMYTFDENGDVTFPAKIIKSGGTSAQFLKANGDIDSTTYVSGAGTGLTKDGVNLKHSNSVTADTTGNFKKLTYDSQGHITGTVNVQASDLPTHSHGASDLPTSSTSAKGIVKLVNDLTTGGTDKALTAEQGKVLNVALGGKIDTAGTSMEKDGTTLGVKSSGITATQLASNAVTTDKINVKAVTTAKIDDGAVTATQLESTVQKKSFVSLITLGTSEGTDNIDNLYAASDQGRYYCKAGNIGNLGGTLPPGWTTASNKHMLLLVYNNNSSKTIQEAFQISASTNTTLKRFWRMYTDYPTSVKWSDWQEVYTDKTIPSASTSQAGIVELVNDVTTGGTDKALTAEQGKVLNTAISNARVFKAYIRYNNNTAEAPSDLSNMSMVHGNKIYFGCTDQNNDYLEGYVYVDFNDGASFTKYTLSYGWYAMTLSNAGIYNIRVYFADSVNRIVASGMCHVNVS